MTLEICSVHWHPTASFFEVCRIFYLFQNFDIDIYRWLISIQLACKNIKIRVHQYKTLFAVISYYFCKAGLVPFTILHYCSELRDMVCCVSSYIWSSLFITRMLFKGYFITIILWFTRLPNYTNLKSKWAYPRRIPDKLY